MPGPSDVSSELPNSSTRPLRRSTNESETSANNDEPEGGGADEKINQTAKDLQEQSNKDDKSMRKIIFKNVTRD